MKKQEILLLMLAMAGLMVLATSARAQLMTVAGDSSSAKAMPPAVATQPVPDQTYTRPTQKTKIHNYLFDAFGPYPTLNAAVFAGIDQWDNSPPEWKQGMAGYGERFGSNYAIAAVTTTTRYALAEAFHEDALYYRCDCTGFFPRLNHALVSTFMARRGEDGHRVFSFAGLVSPYAGTMTAVYGWYPGRYDAMDGFRMGNYRVLGYVGENIALEFLYSRKRTWLTRMHLDNGHGAPASAYHP
ncbi:MAG: hypothetical protein ABSD20_08630 [Terriglobales bacterium]|jgi:hypothetical protein